MSAIETPDPSLVWHPDEDYAACPWCGADMSNATVSLESLLRALVDGALHNAPPAGVSADEMTIPRLVVDCPDCARPSSLAVERGKLEWHDLIGRLYPLRTSKDFELLQARTASGQHHPQSTERQVR